MSLLLDLIHKLVDLEPVSITNLTLNDSCLKKGSEVAIHCNIRGFPHPMIQFLLNEVVITPGVGQFENFI